MVGLHVDFCVNSAASHLLQPGFTEPSLAEIHSAKSAVAHFTFRFFKRIAQRLLVAEPDGADHHCIIGLVGD